MAKNTAAQKQLEKIKEQKNIKMEKRAQSLTGVAIACAIAFVGMLALKLSGAIYFPGWALAFPFVILFGYFIYVLVTTGKELMNQGLLNPSEIKAEEKAMMDKKTTNIQKKYNNNNYNYNKNRNNNHKKKKKKR